VSGGSGRSVPTMRVMAGGAPQRPAPARECHRGQDVPRAVRLQCGLRVAQQPAGAPEDVGAEAAEAGQHGQPGRASRTRTQRQHARQGPQHGDSHPDAEHQRDGKVVPQLRSGGLRAVVGDATQADQDETGGVATGDEAARLQRARPGHQPRTREHEREARHGSRRLREQAGGQGLAVRGTPGASRRPRRSPRLPSRHRWRG
jgi:hypothetical protein